jgi:transcriptional regulator with XRE-family HTH domain
MTARLLEQAVGSEIRRLLTARKLTATEVERRLHLPGGSVQDLAAGHPNLELATLRRVLTFLEVDPSAFFARLLAEDAGGGLAVDAAAGGDATDFHARPEVARRQVAGLIEQVRRALLEIDPAEAESGGGS